MKKRRKGRFGPGLRGLAGLALLLLLATAFGCRRAPENASLEEGQYYTYYVNQAGTALVSRVYETRATDMQGVVAELLAQCQTAPEDGDGRRVIPANVALAGPARLDGNVVNIYFDTTYALMDKVTELLCRAGLAKTLTQPEEVEYISIYVNGKPYTGASSLNGLEGENGAGSGEGGTGSGNGGQGTAPPAVAEQAPVLISGSDFLDNTGDVTNQYDQAELTLYFANEEGNGLVAEERSVVYSNNLSLERVVLNQLIEGPASEGAAATLPSTLKVQGVSLRDTICYVDFDNTFLEDALNVADAAVIYSIVNSLTELPSVGQVQITVNGSADVSFRNNISLSSRFERALEYVAEEESEAASQ